MPRLPVAQNALKLPKGPDDQALQDLELCRSRLLDRLRDDETSSRDLAAISAELRKVNLSIAALKTSGPDMNAEAIAAAAANTMAKLDRLHESRQANKGLAEVPTTPEETTQTGT